MIETFGWIHPSFVLILGALVIPFVKGLARKVYLVGLPLVVLALILTQAPGTYGTVPLLEFDLTFGRVDALSLVFANVFGIILVVGAIYALHVDDTLQHVAGYIYAGSALGVIFAGDLITVYIFWEMMVFSSVWLIWCRRDEVSWAAGWRYTLVHAAGGVLLLGGIILYFLETGTTSFDALQDVGLAFYLILIGFMINAAVPPLHAWLTDAYPEATITGAILLSAFTTKTAVYTLIRGYPGTEILIVLGVIMALWGVVYAVLANDIRRLLAYHIVSQVGYMVAGVGLGTAMALNGAASHAFAHILYKALLFMGAGAVIHMTGKSKLTELGGIYKYMPMTFLLYMVGGFAISAFPLTSGFVTKTMIIDAAAREGIAWMWLLLSLASAGTFLHTGLKLPYFTFLGKDSGLRPKEAPTNMLIAMGIAAFLCIFIGVYPQWVYSMMPTPVAYNAYTAGHVLWELQVLLFTGLAFFLLLKYAGGERKISLDTDWFYRRLGWDIAQAVVRAATAARAWALGLAQQGLTGAFQRVYRYVGPGGILARNWSTGAMAFWTTVLLAVWLLAYLL
ncbi:MAG: Na(+)/H(+) antiporter subunit D [Aliihoeflea sp.]